MMLGLALFAAACGGDDPGTDDPGTDATETQATGSPAETPTGAETGGEAAACETPDEWVIGWINPLSGNAATFGELSRNATEMALEKINDDGGINGVPVRVQYEDNELAPEPSITAAQKLAGEGVNLIITAGSSVVFALDPIAQQEDLLIANHAAQSPKLITDAPRTYNFIPTSASEVERLAELAIDRLGVESVGVLHVDNDYGQDTTDAFVEAFEGLGGTITTREVHELGATDMRTQLIQIRGSEPDAVIFVSNVTEVGHGVAQAREVGIDSDLLGLTFALSPDNFAIAGEAMNGMHGVAITFRPDANPEAETFAQEYQSRYDGEPTIYAATAYDAIGILTDAIEATGCDTHEAVSEYLTSLEGYQGVLGDTSMGDDRTVDIPLFEYQIVDGEAVPWEE